MARLTADHLTSSVKKWPKDNLHIGISGWTYPPWRGVFYPKKLPHRLELQFASCEFKFHRNQRQLYVSGYSDKEIEWWANRVEHWRKGRQPRNAKLISSRSAKAGKRDVFVCFDNDAKVHAPFNAKTLAEKF